MPDEDEQAAPADNEGAEDEGGETALVSKSALGGKEYNPGDKIEMQVVAAHGDEYEVKCCPTDEAKPDEGMAGASGRMSAMMDK